MPYPSQTDPAAIVATARALIERHGAERLSLAQLAAALGIKAPSLYRHVSSKTALLQAVNAQTYQDLFQAYAQAQAAAGPDPKSQLLAVFRAHRAFAHAHPAAYVLAFTTTAPDERADARMLERFAVSLQAVVAALTGPEQALNALRGALALVHGFVMLELKAQFQRGGDLTEAYEAAVAAYLAGWARPSAPAEGRMRPSSAR
jgi:AcrR family transcriptional regulator